MRPKCLTSLVTDKIWFKLTYLLCLEPFCFYLNLRKSDDLIIVKLICISFMVGRCFVIFSCSTVFNFINIEKTITLETAS